MAKWILFCPPCLLGACRMCTGEAHGCQCSHQPRVVIISPRSA